MFDYLWAIDMLEPFGFPELGLKASQGDDSESLCSYGTVVYINGSMSSSINVMVEDTDDCKLAVYRLDLKCHCPAINFKWMWERGREGERAQADEE